MRRLLPLAVILLASVHAQPPPCPMGVATAAIEGADVRARLFTNGNLFFGEGFTNGDGYVVPTTGEDAGKSPLFAANLWFSGYVGGTVRTSAARYANFALRPGHTGADGTPPTPDECASADRIWVVSRDDVAAYLRNGTLADDLRDWPVSLGAPVLDGDGDPANYNLAGGDQPAIRGDVMAYWAMTDTARPGSTWDGPPVGLDVAVEAYGFRSAPFVTGATGRLAGTTVYRVTATNRAGVPVDSLHMGLFLDPDLGHALDDYMGTDVPRQMVYAYNADENDEGETGYGVPPAFGAVVLGSPLSPTSGAPMGLRGASDYFAPPSPGDPIPDPIVGPYCAMTGREVWCAPIHLGRMADQPVTRYVFPADPLAGAFWSEENTDGSGTRSSIGDRRAVLSTGPVRLLPGASATWEVALVFAQGASRFHSVERLRSLADVVRAVQQQGLFEPSRVVDTSSPPDPMSAVTHPSPNPFADRTTIRLNGLAGVPVTVTVLDVLGRELDRRQILVGDGSVAVALGAGLAPGVYRVRVTGSGFDVSLPMTKHP